MMPQECLPYSEARADNSGRWQDQTEICSEGLSGRLVKLYNICCSTNLDICTDEHPDFIACARDLADALRNTIFVDQVVSTAMCSLMWTLSHSANF